MTREEAINILRTERVEIGGITSNVLKFVEALNFIIDSFDDECD